jgi:ATP-dependent helicase HrpA
MKSLRLGEIESFPFLESPDGRYIRDGYKQLQELQAIDEKGHLTRLGKQMARLPLEPSLARMLLAAVDLGVLDDVLIIVSGLEAQDPRDRPLDKQAAADEAHQQFQHPRSDFLTLLALWRTFQEKSAQLSQNKARKWCQENFISWRRLREWEDVWRQLAGLCAELRQGGAPERVNLTRPQKSGHRNDANRLVSQVESDREGRSTTSQSEPDYAAIHQALLTGLLSNVAVIEEKDLYLGTRSARFRIFPDSTLLKRKPKWLMAAELIETSAQFARMGAEIEPRWVEEAAQHLVHRHLHSPWWDAKKGRVSAYERITLYGLLLNPRRKVDLTTRDPVMAHELFIREALVARKLEKRYPFYLANNQLIDQVRLMESKIRRQDLLVEEDAIYALYAERIPQEVVSVSTLSKWLMQNPGAEKRLFFDFDMLLLRDPDRDVAVRFPDKMEVEGVPLPLSYCFEPGNEADGVTVSLPLSLLGRINAARLSWGVPGIWEEKITEMIRVLPKTIRRRLVPAPDFARKASLLLTEDASRFFTEAVAYGLGQLAQIPLDPQVWAEATIPEHLLMRIAVVEDSGAILATGRNLDELKRHFAEDLERLGKGMLHQNWQKTDIVVWDFGEIPEQVETTVGGVAVSGWPCLAVDNGRVSLMLETDRQRADERMREGVARLIQHIHKKEIKSFLREREVEEILIQYSGLGKVEAMANSLVEAIYRTVYARSDASMPRNAQQFDHYIREHRLQLHETRCRYCSLLKEAVELYRQVRLAMKQEVPLGLIRIVQEIRDHVDRLVYDRFLDDVSLVQLQHYPRYLKASLKRIEKLRSDPKRDNQRAALVEPLEKQFQQWLQRHPDRVGAEPVLHYRWLLEEWRVSVFAQELGTAEPVSEKRLSRLWAEIDRPEYRY